MNIELEAKCIKSEDSKIIFSMNSFTNSVSIETDVDNHINFLTISFYEFELIAKVLMGINQIEPPEQMK